MSISKHQNGGSRRAPRRDGTATRSVILEAAGQVFAERGFSDATSKEICERAGANSAAVNYYFGGKESLYGEVLREAHQQMLRFEDLNAIIASAMPPEEKLRAFLGGLIHTATVSSGLWGLKVFLRELAVPTPHVAKAMDTAVLPKTHLLRRLIADLTGLDPESAKVQRAVAFVVLPCVSLIMFPESLRTRVLPATAARGEGMLEDMLAYALGGLRAIGKGGKGGSGAPE